MNPRSKDHSAPALFSGASFSEETSCIEYDGYLNDDGYGCLRVGGKLVRAHRLMMRLVLGRPLSSGEVVMHRCDNPACINPNHLRLGTHTENRSDCVRKNRHAKGSEHGRAKLTEEDIPSIRERLKTPDPIAQIARDYGVSPRAIRQVRNGETWTHV